MEVWRSLGHPRIAGLKLRAGPPASCPSWPFAACKIPVAGFSTQLYHLNYRSGLIQLSLPFTTTILLLASLRRATFGTPSVSLSEILFHWTFEIHGVSCLSNLKVENLPVVLTPGQQDKN